MHMVGDHCMSFLYHRWVCILVDPQLGRLVYVPSSQAPTPLGLCCYPHWFEGAELRGLSILNTHPLRPMIDEAYTCVMHGAL